MTSLANHRHDLPEPAPPSRMLVGGAILAVALVLLFGRPIIMFSWAFYELIVQPAEYHNEKMYPVYTYRFRLTINVDVDGETRTGSGVYEVSAKPGPKGTNWGQPYSKGEAIFIDLGKYGPLVMTLHRPHYGAGYDCPATMIGGAFWAPPGAKLNRSESDQILSSSDHPPVPMGAGGLCEMVTFENVDDPKTIRLVDPMNLEVSFDGHVHFRSAMVEVTRDPITHGIEGYLHWLPDVQKHIGGQLDEEKFVAQMAQFRANKPITIGIDKQKFQYFDFIRDAPK